MTVTPVISPFYKCSQFFNTTVTTISHDDTMSAEKITFLKFISFTIYKHTSAHSFWATRVGLVLKEAEWSALQKHRKFFNLIFELKREQAPEFRFCYAFF